MDFFKKKVCCLSTALSARYIDPWLVIAMPMQRTVRSVVVAFVLLTDGVVYASLGLPPVVVEGKRTLPSIDCIRIVALEDSPMVAVLSKELKRVGLMDSRVAVHYSKRDAREGAGCWNAHVAVWKNLTASGCTNSLILEEDATFRWSRFLRSTQIEKFIALNQPYDTLQLGMWHNGITVGSVPILIPDFKPGYTSTSYTPFPKVPCVARSIGEPGSSHAYIISQKAAREWRPEWQPHRKEGRHHIDQWMKRDTEHENYVILPSIVFQRHHESQNMQSIVSKKMEIIATGNTRAHALLERRFFSRMPSECWPGKQKKKK